jgi:hypothetical protein
VYILLEAPLFEPRALFGFGGFLAIFCISVVSDYKKIAVAAVFALNWCFLVFAFSYGNALADQARYAEFRIGLLLHDLSALYPDMNEVRSIKLKDSIEFAPTIKNIAKHYPIIIRLVPSLLAEEPMWSNTYYYLGHFNHDYKPSAKIPDNTIGYDASNLPVVLDSYYHTIKGDENHILIILKH